MIVLNQLGIMTLMVSLGFIASKCLKIDKEGSRQMSLVLTRVITACVLLVSFLEVEANRENLVLLLLAWGLCLIAHLIAIALGGIFFQKDGKSRNAVAKFALTFTNNGFLGFPLVLVLCGQRGIFFASAAVMLSNILTWTYGVSLFQKHKINLVKELLMQPTLWAVALGLPIFLLRLFAPDTITAFPPFLDKILSIIGEALSYLKGMYTPMAMLIMGINLQHTGLLACFKSPRSYLVSILRTVVMPLLVLLVLAFLPIGDKDLLLTVFLINACPCAMITSMISVLYGDQTQQEEANHTIVLSTILTPVTIPLMVLLAGVVLQV